MGNTHYEGPCPPVGENRQYYFRLYAVDTLLNFAEGATRAQVIDALHEHILEQTEMIGAYQRSGTTSSPSS
jgi:phosphatidylethanolamine-binding protein (PEBP) family uncharacterized protein